MTAGGKDDPINEKGIEFYNNLVNTHEIRLFSHFKLRNMTDSFLD